MRFVKTLFVALFLSLVLVGCDKSSPTGPGPVPSPAHDPVPAGGMTLFKFGVPDLPEPELLWVTSLNPSMGGRVPEDLGKAIVRWTCKGPVGYNLFVAAHFIFEGQPEPDPRDRSGGSSTSTVNNCGNVGISLGGVANYMGENVLGLRFLVWRKRGTDPNIFFPNCWGKSGLDCMDPADYILDQPLGPWKGWK